MTTQTASSESQKEQGRQSSQSNFSAAQLSELREEIQKNMRTVLVGGSEVVLLTNAQLAWNNRKGMVLKILLAAALLLSITANFAEYGFRPEPRVVVEDANGRIRKLPTLREPIMSPSDVAFWTVGCVEETFKFNWSDIPSHRLRLSRCFDQKSLNSIQNALRANGMYDAVEANHYLASAHKTDDPTIAWQGVHEGKLAYRIEVPIQVSYTSDKGKEPGKKWIAVVSVSRVSLNVSEEGIQIVRLRIMPG